MEYFWAAIIAIIVGLIVTAWVSSRLKDRRMRKAMDQILPTIESNIDPSKHYNVFLSHGKVFTDVRFVGLSKAFDPQHPEMPFPLTQWLVLETADGRKISIKPVAIRYFEEL